jgi:hypothetical protein
MPSSMNSFRVLLFFSERNAIMDNVSSRYSLARYHSNCSVARERKTTCHRYAEFLSYVGPKHMATPCIPLRVKPRPHRDEIHQFPLDHTTRLRRRILDRVPSGAHQVAGRFF